MNPYIIGNVNTEKKTEFWSNEDGWADLASATRFTEKEKETLRLPMDGSWLTLWEVNSIQFARFIAECEAGGVFSDKDRMEQVAGEMDLSLDEVYELVSRAQTEWDDFKAIL